MLSNQAKLFIGASVAAGGIWYLTTRKNKDKLFAEQKRGGENVPGRAESMTARVGESMASMTQNFAPIKQFDTHVASIRCYGNNTKRQIPVHEYIMHINEDVMQAILYDSDLPTAKVVGVEYIISDKLYRQLPEEEKKFWYNHAFEVKSGTMVAPRMPNAMEKKLMSNMGNTWGKTINLWQVDRDRLPMGVPTFMTSPTDYNTLNNDLIARRDAQLGIDTMKERKNRESIKF